LVLYQQVAKEVPDKHTNYTEKDEIERIISLLKNNNSQYDKIIMDYKFGDTVTTVQNKIKGNIKESKLNRDKQGIYHILVESQ